MKPMNLADYKHLEHSIREAVFSALEDTGLDVAGATKLIETMGKVSTAADLLGWGLRDYKAKVAFNGAPKPRAL
tara:strand:- start:86 stop:307 length:222 start_codon:yes stop_codon:yes gene_type:complete